MANKTSYWEMHKRQMEESSKYGLLFILNAEKSEVEKYYNMLDRHKTELENAIAEDKTGLGFIRDMFLCELDNHEFGYTMELDSTLDYLGYTMEEIKNNKLLSIGLNSAIEEFKKRECD